MTKLAGTVWYFDAIGARFRPHGAIFHDDGTLTVTFPDAAEASRSAGTGFGIWRKTGPRAYALKFLENNATRDSQPESTLIVEGSIEVDEDGAFEGSATATYFDMAGVLVNGPFPAVLKGQQVTWTSGGPVMSTDPDPA